jgi:hypothetical protein
LKPRLGAKISLKEGTMITIPAHGKLPIETYDHDVYFSVVDGSGWIISCCARNGRYLKKGDVWLFKKGQTFGFRTETESLTVAMRPATRADEEACEKAAELAYKKVCEEYFKRQSEEAKFPRMLSEAGFVKAVWEG